MVSAETSREGIDVLSRGLIEASPEALIVVDPEGRIVLFNPAAEKMFGWSRGELASRSIETLVPEGFREAHALHRKRFLERALPRMMGIGLELEGRRRDGTTFPVDVSLSPIPTAHGLYVGATLRDISERVRTITELKKSEAAFRELIEQASDAVFVADLDGRYTDVNTAACRMLGYARDELIGKTIVDLLLPEDVPRLQASKEFLLAPGHVEVSSWVLRAKSGAHVPVEVSAKIHGDGRWVAFVRDISERLRQEEALRLSEASLADAQRVAHMGSWDWDLRTNQVLRSDELFRIFGLEPGAVSTERGSVASYIHPDDRERALAIVDQAAQGGGSYAMEHRIVREDGEERIVWQQGKAIVENGRAVRMVGTLIDVTERRRAEQALERLRAEWSSVVAHDLRQPVNTIFLFAQLLARSTDPADVKECTDRIRKSAERLNRMIEDIMDLSRLEARRLRLSRQTIDVVVAVRGVLDQLRATAPDRAVELRATGDLSPIDADPDRIAQIMDNLLTNAVKYGEGPILVEIEGATDEIGIAVTNTGKGIAPEDLPQLFQRFQRTGDARSSKIKGTGLGLYIVRELVEAHGGAITCESTPGKTTTFRLTLPRKGR